MKTPVELALIEDAVGVKSFLIAGINSGRQQHTKIYFGDNSGTGWLGQSLPGVEVVHNADSILKDNDIDLVLIPEAQKDNLGLVATVLTTGKNVRIV